MSRTPHKPHHGDKQDDPEPGAMPVEPDAGAPLPGKPADPEHDSAPAPEI